jgi:hypothetical protein
MVNRSTDGKESVRKGLEELEKFGYLERTQNKDSSGKFTAFEYIFHEIPIEIKIILPQPDFPVAEKPISVNPPLISTDSLPSTKQQQQAVVVEGEIAEFASLLKALCLAKCKSCTPEEFDLNNDSFFTTGIQEFGFAAIHHAVLNYFTKTTLKQRLNIHTPAGILLINLRTTQKKGAKL